MVFRSFKILYARLHGLGVLFGTREQSHVPCGFICTEEAIAFAIDAIVVGRVAVVHCDQVSELVGLDFWQLSFTLIDYPSALLLFYFSPLARRTVRAHRDMGKPVEQHVVSDWLAELVCRLGFLRRIAALPRLLDIGGRITGSVAVEHVVRGRNFASLVGNWLIDRWFGARREGFNFASLVGNWLIDGRRFRLPAGR